MKNRFISIIFVLFIFMGCQQSFFNDGEFASLSINVCDNETERTALPVFDVSDLKNLALYGKNLTAGQTEYIKLKEWDDYSSIASSVLTVKKGNWDFKLTARIGGSQFEGSKTVNVESSSSKITFNLSQTSKDVENLTGSFELKLTYPIVTGVDVKSVKVQLYDAEKKEVGSSATVTPNVSGTKATAIAKKSGLTAGIYFVKFFLYNDTACKTLLNEMIEMIVVENGLNSKSDLEIKEFDKLYTVKLNHYGSVTSELKYTMRYGLELPKDVERTGYAFTGWYADSSLEGDAVKEIAKGSTGDKTFYAKWETGVSYKITEKTQGVDGTYSSTSTEKWGLNGKEFKFTAEEKPGFTVKVEPETLTLDSTSSTQQTVVITYTRKSINWTFKINQNDTTAYKTVSKLYGQSWSSADIPANPASSQKPGYHFENWVYPDDFPKTELDKGSVVCEKDYEIYGKWHAIQKYTVSYKTEYGTKPADVSLQCESQLLATYLPALKTAKSSDGKLYVFDNWYYSNGKAAAAGDAISSDIELTAKWNLADDFIFVEGKTIYGASNLNRTYSGAFPTGRTVTLSDFYISPYEVTRELYKSVMSGNSYGIAADPSRSTYDTTTYVIADGEDKDKRPVEELTWYDAVYFCNLYSIKQGLDPVYSISSIQTTSGTINGTTVKQISSATVSADFTKNGYRLPTEAEWEYAARGGNKSSEEVFGYCYAGADTTSPSSTYTKNLDDVAWYLYNTTKTGGISSSTSASSGAKGYSSHEVGKKKPNALGLYDMSGNAEEWCWDGYGTISTTTVKDPKGVLGASERVVRGGTWRKSATGSVVSARFYGAPGSRLNAVGFRLVRSAK